MKRIELLAPAGDPEKLAIALAYGADAVYLGAEAFGLRAGAGNFSVEELRNAAETVHRAGKKLYLTLNIFAHEDDIEAVEAFLPTIADIPMDGYLVSDPGMLALVRDRIPGAALHLSTQANTTNGRSVAYWRDAGVCRVVLARELSFTEIHRIRERVGDTVELEAFVHGAMCISYSGRCLLSSVLTGRDANRGACTHPCRWSYHLVEEKRPGEFFPVEEGPSGTHVLNSKDLCMLPHIPDLAASGLDSLKIEGRGKSVYYLASVVGAYRRALDAYYEDPAGWTVRDEWIRGLDRASHRRFTTGFYFGDPGSEGQEPLTSSYVRDTIFLGVVRAFDPANYVALVEQRNKIVRGDRIELFGPEGTSFFQIVEDLRDADGVPIEAAPHPRQLIRLRVDQPVSENSMVCRDV